MKPKEMASFALRTLYSPVQMFHKVTEEQSYADPLVFILGFGLMTAILSSFLNEFGVDYSDWRNAGGSAQLLAPWVVENFASDFRGIRRAMIFALSIEVGYLVLTVLSVLVLSFIIRLFVKELNKRKSCLLRALKAVCYGMCPALFFGWIPNPIALFGIWALIWQTIAVYVFFDLSKVKAVIVVVLWMLIVGILHDLGSLFWGLTS